MKANDSATAKLFPDRVFEATNISVSAGTNVPMAVYHGPAFTNTQMVATNTSTVVMATPVFAYDTKGNLTNDAEFVYQYDIANRLTNVVSIRQPGLLYSGPSTAVRTRFKLAETPCPRANLRPGR